MAAAVDSLTHEWERARRQGPGRERAWLTRLRDEAWHRFASRGFPTTRDEEWRFTSVTPIAEEAFTRPEPTPGLGAIAIDRFRLPASATELVFVNGRYMPSWSRLGGLPSGARVESLAAWLSDGRADLGARLARVATTEQHPFVALNTAFFEDGAVVHVRPGVVVDRPIHLLFITAGHGNAASIMSHPRVLAVLDANSQASIVETHAGANGERYFTNAVTEILAGDNAVLDHYRLQDESPLAYHVGGTHVRAARGAHCTSHSISIGGALVRNDVVAVLDGEGGGCTLNGLYVADAQRLVDNHTTIDHAQAHCSSREIYKGILAERARGVFNGKIIVRPDAQKTDARQTSRALLLSEDAVINTKPQLEIFANDVKCTHGAAIGQLDDEAVFYLRSRGLGQAAARRLLIHAFAADVLNRLPLAGIRAAVADRLQHQLARVVPEAA